MNRTTWSNSLLSGFLLTGLATDAMAQASADTGGGDAPAPTRKQEHERRGDRIRSKPSSSGH